MANQNTLPPVEDLPLLEDATKTMNMSVATGASGTVYVIHEKPFSEPVNWVEYNIDEKRLTFVSTQGRIQNIGLTIPEKLTEIIENQDAVILVHLVDGAEKEVFKLPLVRQKY